MILLLLISIVYICILSLINIMIIVSLVIKNKNVHIMYFLIC